MLEGAGRLTELHHRTVNRFQLPPVEPETAAARAAVDVHLRPVGQRHAGALRGAVRADDIGQRLVGDEPILSMLPSCLALNT